MASLAKTPTAGNHPECSTGYALEPPMFDIMALSRNPIGPITSSQILAMGPLNPHGRPLTLIRC